MKRALTIIAFLFLAFVSKAQYPITNSVTIIQLTNTFGLSNSDYVIVYRPGITGTNLHTFRESVSNLISDLSGLGVGNLRTNPNQFGSSVTLSIKSSALFTNPSPDQITLTTDWPNSQSGATSGHIMDSAGKPRAIFNGTGDSLFYDRSGNAVLVLHGGSQDIDANHQGGIFNAFGAFRAWTDAEFDGDVRLVNSNLFVNGKAAANGITSTGSVTVTTGAFTGNGASVTNLPTSLTNASHFDITAGIIGLKTIGAGANVIITNESGTNLVIASTATGGNLQTNVNQFGAAVVLTIAQGALMTNGVFYAPAAGTSLPNLVLQGAGANNSGRDYFNVTSSGGDLFTIKSNTPIWVLTSLNSSSNINANSLYLTNGASIGSDATNRGNIYATSNYFGNGAVNGNGITSTGVLASVPISLSDTSGVWQAYESNGTHWFMIQAPRIIQSNNVTRWTSNGVSGIMVLQQNGADANGITNDVVPVPNGTGALTNNGSGGLGYYKYTMANLGSTPFACRALGVAGQAGLREIPLNGSTDQGATTSSMKAGSPLPAMTLSNFILNVWFSTPSPSIPLGTGTNIWVYLGTNGGAGTILFGPFNGDGSTTKFTSTVTATIPEGTPCIWLISNNVTVAENIAITIRPISSP